MKLKTSLQLSAVFPLLLAIIVSVGLFLRSATLNMVHAEAAAAEEAVALIEALNSSASEHLKSNSSNTLKSWHSSSADMDKFLAAQQSTDLAAKYTHDDIKASYLNIKDLLLGLTGSGKLSNAQYLETEKKLLKHKSALYAAAVKLVKLGTSNAAALEKSADTYFMVFVGIIALLMAYSTIEVGRSVLHRVTDLRNAANNVAEGNFQNMLDVKERDEIGQTIKAFNSMVGRLRKSFDSLKKESDDSRKDADGNKRSIDNARQTNMQLADALTKLKRAQGQIIQQERVRALEQIGVGVTRDFNSTLTPILNASDYLLSYPKNLEDRAQLIENLKAINSAAQEGRKLVRRLSQVFHSYESPQSESVDLNKVIKEAVDFLSDKKSSLESTSSIAIEYDINLGRLPEVDGSSIEFMEAVSDIVINAFEAMPSGGTVQINSCQESGQVILSISDTGEGMSEEVWHRSIEPFFSTKGTTHSGMGLTSAMSVFGHFGGTLDVDAPDGKGTTVTVKIPVGKYEQGEMRGLEADGARKSLKVLVVDDEEWVRKILVRSLEAEGHNVDSAGLGKEGIEKCAENEFDVVVLDWALPDMNGDEIAINISKNHPTLPIIVLTGLSDFVRGPDGSLPKGVDCILSKPVTMKELCVVMYRVIT